MPASEKATVDSEENGDDQATIAHVTILEDNIDDAILRANGHRPELKRQFNWLSALGLGFSITNSWAGYLSCFGQSLQYGGPQACLLSLVVAFFVQFTITLGLSEIASAFPSTGGQYHFCYILSADKTKRFSAYVIGWMSMLAWWIVTCSGVSLAAATLSGMINFFHPEFVATAWQVYFFYVATAVITAIPVFLSSKRLSWTVQTALFLSVLGVTLFLFIPVGLHQQVNDGSYLVKSGLGNSGWDAGTGWALAISNSMYAFGGTDGAIHISEEIANPGRRVPQVIIMTMFIGIGTALPLFIALMFFMADLDAVRASPLPSMELIYQATGDRNVTIFLITLLLLVFILSLPSQWVASGRIAWAFARDNGVPLSEYFSKVDGRLEFPVRTTIAAFVFVLLYGLLYLASTTAFNSIVTSAVLFLNITYAVPQGILLFQGRHKHLPPRYLNLGILGYFCNGFSILWIVVLGVLVSMPPSLPVSVQTMNYTSVILVGLFVIIILQWYFDGRKRFQGPHIDWELIKEANTQMLKNNQSESEL
ncbi:putative choline transporter [Rosellinia necatrix]|uniref:Putative choline transporter n=1 Tax=Rosellinia necatrix TaxID=77044 RepID=A0A1W2TCN4_ROSNE|nr:putative choline transporter [Rosellinia necatrix]